jgi:membrane associated rhomboid family serine protease
MKRSPVTMLLLASIAAMFAVELARGALGKDAELLSLGALRDTGGLGRDYWRLLAHGWLHASWTHFLLNAALLYWTGRIVERRIGSAQTLAIYLLGVLGGGAGSAIRAALHPKSGATLGASAGAFALLACAIVLLYRPAAARFGQSPRVRLALVTIAVAGVAVSFIPGVSLVAHAVGLAVGSLAGALARPSRAASVAAPV